MNVLIQSPLNYTGGKYKLLPQILPFFPKKIGTFIDLFCGGGNVGININADYIIYNDINRELIYLFNTFYNLDKESIFDWIYQIIEQYGLSQVSKYGYDYYGCNSSKGLSEYNKKYFLKLRDDFNTKINEDYYYYVMLYVLIVYSFNNQIRFNSNGYFNLPVGKRDFNKKMEEKLTLFLNKLKQQNCVFKNKDFRYFYDFRFSNNDFVYIDPPYLITCATYNEQGAWTDKDEIELLHFLDYLDKNGVSFALSNVLQSKGRYNEILQKWLMSNKKYIINYLNYSYSNSNYQIKNKEANSVEVLITNYGG